MKEYQLIPYCAQTNCIECEHTIECKHFFENHNQLPYLFYKPYVKTDIEYLLDKLDVPVDLPELKIDVKSYNGSDKKKRKKMKKLLITKTDDLLKKIEEVQPCTYEELEDLIIEYSVDYFDNLESFNIIRCKNCKHYSYRSCHLFDGLTVPGPDDYCSYGERRDFINDT